MSQYKYLLQVKDIGDAVPDLTGPGRNESLKHIPHMI